MAFGSTATNLDPADTDSFTDVYIKDLATGDITLASTSDTGVKGNGRSGGTSLSADGTRLAFGSSAINLDPADTDSIFDVYVKDLATGNITLASTSDTGIKGNGDSYFMVLSADGATVAFVSEATNLDPADTDSTADVYVKDLATGDITLASTSDSGIKADGDSFIQNFSSPSLSADGTRVAFYSNATNLDPADTDSTADVYVKDLATGDITFVSISESGIKGNGESITGSLSADGTRVAFGSSATNLDPADTDSTLDVYVKDLGPLADVGGPFGAKARSARPGASRHEARLRGEGQQPRCRPGDRCHCHRQAADLGEVRVGQTQSGLVPSGREAFDLRTRVSRSWRARQCDDHRQGRVFPDCFATLSR